MMKLRVESVQSEEQLRTLQSEWCSLIESLDAPLPFETWWWSQTWWRHLSAHSTMLRDELWVQTIRDGQGQLVAVAPMMRTLRPGVGPFQLRHLQFFGADPLITEIRRMPCLPGYEIEAHRTLASFLQSRNSQWDWVTWSGLSPEVAEAVGLRPRAEFSHEQESFVLDLPGTWEEFKRGLKRNIKESLRKCYNAPKRDGITFRFDAVGEPEGIARAVERFLVLHQKRAQQTGTVQHKDVFAGRTARHFLLDVCARLVEKNAVRVFSLLHEDQVVATRIGFLNNGHLFLYYSGYEPSWGKYSVMTRALAETIQWSIRQGLSSVNLSTGRDVSKLRWGPVQKSYFEYVELSPHLRSRLSFRMFQRVQALGGGRLLGRFRRAAADAFDPRF